MQGLFRLQCPVDEHPRRRGRRPPHAHQRLRCVGNDIITSGPSRWRCSTGVVSPVFKIIFCRPVRRHGLLLHGLRARDERAAQLVGLACVFDAFALASKPLYSVMMLLGDAQYEHTRPTGPRPASDTSWRGGAACPPPPEQFSARSPGRRGRLGARLETSFLNPPPGPCGAAGLRRLITGSKEPHYDVAFSEASPGTRNR